MQAAINVTIQTSRRHPDQGELLPAIVELIIAALFLLDFLQCLQALLALCMEDQDLINCQIFYNYYDS